MPDEKVLTDKDVADAVARQRHGDAGKVTVVLRKGSIVHIREERTADGQQGGVRPPGPARLREPSKVG